jgi:hypothetical protein
MSLHSRLPIHFTLDNRVDAINALCDKLSKHGAQTERLRLRVAIELYVVQKIVQADGEPWEAWCETHINRSLGDIRKLLKMAASHDPEAAHEAEKASKKAARRKQNGSNTVQRAPGRAISGSKQSAKAARKLISAILSCHSIDQARAMLGVIDIGDLIDALDEAEAAATLTDVVPVVSTATH